MSTILAIIIGLGIISAVFAFLFRRSVRREKVYYRSLVEREVKLASQMAERGLEGARMSFAEVKFRHMYRFMPALVYIERVCRRNGLGSESRAGWFGRELAKQGDQEDLGEIFTNFLASMHKAGIQLDTYHYYNLLDKLDKPDWNTQTRIIREWDGKPWPAKERALIEPMSKLEYLMYENEKQDEYVAKAKQFFERFR